MATFGYISPPSSDRLPSPWRRGETRVRAEDCPYARNRFLALARNYLPDYPPPYADWKSASLGTLCRASVPGARPLGPWPCADASGRRRPTRGRRPTAGYGRGAASPLQSARR